MEELFMNYIVKSCVIVIIALYIIGMMLKATPKVPDWTIPYILGVIGILLCVLIIVSTGGTIVDGIIQGVIAAGIAVYANQLIKQIATRN